MAAILKRMVTSFHIFRHLINYSKVHRYAELDGYIFLLYRAMNFHGQATYGQILFL